MAVVRYFVAAASFRRSTAGCETQSLPVVLRARVSIFVGQADKSREA
jgi:hypothetical protein